jgi:stearoyl-CoA desaturase (delta-9 desaturase)
MNTKIDPRTAAVTAAEKFWIAVFVTVPLAATAVGVFQLWNRAVDAVSLLLCLLFYLLSTLGVTVGFHRCFTHRGFRIKKPWLETLIAGCGSMAAEGSLFTWVGWHRIHHLHSDQEGDLHSPYRFGHGFWGIFKGFLFAHVGWLFSTPYPDQKFVGPIESNPRLVAVDRRFVLWIIAGLVLPPLLGLALRLSADHLLADFLWGGLIRLCLAHHVTWCVNSVCHIWGSRPFASGDRSTNNLAVAILASGEGWHNNHHRFERSARHGLLPGQFDLSWLVIRAFERLGWVDEVHVPGPEKIRRALAEAAPPPT